MTPAELLTKARALLEKPEAWRQGLPSETNPGLCCADSMFVACGFAHGVKITDPEWAVLDEARNRFRLAVGTDCIPVFNDHPDTTHAMVLAAFDRSIRAAS